MKKNLEQTNKRVQILDFFFKFAFVDKLKTRLRYKNSENRNSSIKKLLYTIQAID